MEKNPSSPSHIPALDGVRGIAILVVMLVHASLGFRAASPLADVGMRILRGGWCSIDLFFVLSGYLITRILLRAKSEPRFVSRFYVRRVLRIFPLYYLSLVVAFVLVPLLGRSTPALDGLAHDQVWMWTYLPNVLVALRNDFLPYFHPMWSLGVEEQFYILWPLAVWALSERGLFRLCLALLVVAVALRAALTFNETSPLAIYVLTPTRMDGLLTGSLVALLAHRSQGLAPFVGWSRAAMLVSALALSYLLTLDESWGLPLVQNVGYPLLAVFFATLLVELLALPRGRTSRAFASPFLRFLGKYSYAYYIIHWPMCLALEATGVRRFVLDTVGGSIPGALTYGFLVISACTPLAMLSWYAFESRFLALKDRLAPQAAPTPRVAAA